MDAEKDHQGEFAVLRVIAGRAGSAALADLERECPEPSAAEFHRFLKAANETHPDPTARARRRARTRALLALVLIGLTLLTVFLAGGRKEEGTAQAAELTRLQREVCRRALPFTHRTPSALESLCQPHP
jgi:hypothetical protein